MHTLLLTIAASIVTFQINVFAYLQAKPITLRAFDAVLKNIEEVTNAPVTLKSLLKACPFGIQYDNGIIQSIRRS